MSLLITLEGTGFISPVEAADCFSVCEPGGQPGVLPALIGVHPELKEEIDLYYFPAG